MGYCTSLKCKNPNKNTEDTMPSIWHEEKKATYFFSNFKIPHTVNGTATSASKQGYF